MEAFMGNAMQKLLAGLAGAILIAVLALMLLSSLIAGASAFLSGIGAGSGCPGSSSQTSTATPTACVPPSASAAAVVHVALAMAAHLHLNPACSGVPSWPNCYDTWYDGGFPRQSLPMGSASVQGAMPGKTGTSSASALCSAPIHKLSHCPRVATPLTSGGCIAIAPAGLRSLQTPHLLRNEACLSLVISLCGNILPMDTWPLSPGSPRLLPQLMEPSPLRRRMHRPLSIA